MFSVSNGPPRGDKAWDDLINAVDSALGSEAKPFRPESESRYQRRIPLFAKDGKPHPTLRHYTHWFVHNCIVHPLLGVLPNIRTAELHQLSSNWLNRNHAYRNFGTIERDGPPKIPEEKRGWWFLHNVVAHMAIGLCPTRLTFEFHDWSAKKMDISGWV